MKFKIEDWNYFYFIRRKASSHPAEELRWQYYHDSFHLISSSICGWRVSSGVWQMEGFCCSTVYIPQLWYADMVQNVEQDFFFSTICPPLCPPPHTHTHAHNLSRRGVGSALIAAPWKNSRFPRKFSRDHGPKKRKKRKKVDCFRETIKLVGSQGGKKTQRCENAVKFPLRQTFHKKSNQLFQS